jgi:DNA-directed RNA polymerase specialized sigma54-like protein
MIKESEKIIILKTAITLRKMLSKNKSYSSKSDGNSDVVNSYDKIAANSNSELTKATVNSAFSGKKRSTMATIVLIIESMGYLMKDFAEIYDKLSENEVSKFKEEDCQLSSFIEIVTGLCVYL